MSHKIRESRRVATPTIRGYSYGFICIACEWLSLRDNEFLIIEGNEDVDRVSIDDKKRTIHTEIQYKCTSGTFGPRNKVVYESIGHFLRAWVDHTESDTLFQGKLYTTAGMLDQRSTAIGEWIRGQTVDTDRLHTEVLSLLKAKAIDSTSITYRESFFAFAQCIEWRTACDDLTQSRATLLSSLRKMTLDLNENIAAKTLLDYIVSAGSDDDVRNRKLTRRILWDCINEATLQSLARNVSEYATEMATSGVIDFRGRKATCTIVGDLSELRVIGDASAVWGALSDTDFLASAATTDFICYVAICDARNSARSCRRAVRTQVHLSSGRAVKATGTYTETAKRMAAEIARRCIEFDVDSHNRAPITPFVTKLRWLRRSDGTFFTARQLLVVPQP